MDDQPTQKQDTDIAVSPVDQSLSAVTENTSMEDQLQNDIPVVQPPVDPVVLVQQAETESAVDHNLQPAQVIEPKQTTETDEVEPQEQPEQEVADDVMAAVASSKIAKEASEADIDRALSVESQPDPVTTSDNKPSKQVSENEDRKHFLQESHSKPSSHHRAPIGAIVLAIVIALGLAGLTALAFLKAKQSVKPTNTTIDSSVVQTPATAKDVTDTTAAADAAIQEAEQTDFPDAELSDSALGL